MEKRTTSIESIARPNVLGIDKWSNDTSNKSLKKTKYVKRCTDKIVALYSPKIGGLLNGLSYKPWMENGVQKEDKDGRKLTLQDKMEQKWNLPKGFLTNKPYRNGDSMKESDLTYYQKKTWPLKEGTTILDHSNMDDDLGYYMMLDSKLVANSEKDWRAHKWPHATHYIAQENEEQEIKFKKIQRKSKAFAVLESEDLTPSMQNKFIVILKIASSKNSYTPEQKYNSLYEFIENTDYNLGSSIDKFEELVELLKTSEGRAEIEARFLLQKALDSRVIYEKADTYNWPRTKGLLVLGDRYGDAITFLLNPKKQELVTELEEEIKAKISN